MNEGRRLASDASRSRALVFCVSVAHAEFMTAWLNRAGLPAVCVVGATNPEDRRRAPQRLLSGELCALVTVDHALLKTHFGSACTRVDAKLSRPDSPLPPP